jgi:hypothetical protein
MQAAALNWWPESKRNLGVSSFSLSCASPFLLLLLKEPLPPPPCVSQKAAGERSPVNAGERTRKIWKKKRFV